MKKQHQILIFIAVIVLAVYFNVSQSYGFDPSIFWHDFLANITASAVVTCVALLVAEEYNKKRKNKND